MSNAHWEVYDNGERAWLFDKDEHVRAVITRDEDSGNKWECILFYDCIKGKLYWSEDYTIEEMKWQVTLYINNKCNDIICQTCSIRDHLPSIHELARQAGVI